MRLFIIASCLILGALARPEAPYHYNGLRQQQSRGLPQNVQALKPLAHQQLPSERSFGNFGAPSSLYGAPNSGADQLIDAPVNDLSAQPQEAPHADSYNAAYQHSSTQHDSGYPYVPETVVQKHIYVHVPPKDFDEDDYIVPRVRHQPAPKMKHYKIVFIKAPAAPTIRPPVIPPPPQNEEKTLIYVLHKKPDQQPEIVIPTAEPTQPTKPEVYFIKYKTKKEEAPVYGPPPAGADPRNIEKPSSEYGAPLQASAAPEYAPEDLVAPTTELPLEQQPALNEAIPSDVYGAPTASAIIPEEPEPTIATPNNQYLAPEPQQTMAPIVVEDPHVPATNYGPPNRFFLKKKK